MKNSLELLNKISTGEVGAAEVRPIPVVSD